ncbi:MAG: alpha-L-fucosidase [Phycisphaerae bacterium]|nr:alpha-L-fucosidase [Phycisphaerae bacterium]NIP54427.1 alpha-L-fucosidase [Phycisphaerae bacterium]NIS53286.1 alpha-L-fucosidase [Phycisphaerae bacterium]NIU10812.1 alpha-L-fucosidase [Phycisphaerae bacterium]NIU58607.1 alpha-L-fucosidase [Phycisphaerae bacterium]
MLKQKRSMWSFVIYMSLALCLLTACFTKQVEAGSSEKPKDYLKAGEKDMQAWREMKFGLFIHWGPVSLKGTEIGWSRGGERRGRSGRGSIPAEEYDNLYKKFNPVKFNADEWVQVAKDAGMKYLVFTSKHHDGFSMFDSKDTDYKITNSPFKRDVVKELADACHKAGVKLGYYYSPVDWYHPDYRTKSHNKYIEFMHNQIRQLCTEYGRLDIMWFDGLGGSAKDWDSENMFKMIRKLQPHIIINNRAGLAADHDTPEQRIGKFQHDRAWETCMTICRQWAWKPNDQMKSFKQCIQTLVSTVGGDGNLLFNVGPMPDGRIEPRQVDRLREMGEWLKKHGQSIYGTRGGPFKTGSWGASTQKGNNIYVHVYNWSENGLSLPPIPKKIIASSVLTGGSAKVKQTDEAIEISVPKEHRQEVDTIIKLELDGPASEIAPIGMRSSSLAYGKKAKASNIYRNSAGYRPAKAVDDDPATRWATDAGIKKAWLEVDLGKRTKFNQAAIIEEFDRVRQFELQYKEGGQWRTITEGTKIGNKLQLKFTPVTARHVRLNILNATDGPTICEFQLFAPKKR